MNTWMDFELHGPEGRGGTIKWFTIQHLKLLTLKLLQGTRSTEVEHYVVKSNCVLAVLSVYNELESPSGWIGDYPFIRNSCMTPIHANCWHSLGTWPQHLTRGSLEGQLGAALERIVKGEPTEPAGRGVWENSPVTEGSISLQWPVVTYG